MAKAAVEIAGNTIESAGQRVSPADNLDIDRVWPGARTNAWLSQQIAYVPWNGVISRSQDIVDDRDGSGACCR